ncbi:hypothetical protein B0T11DRAFT_299121 [Plectosphaerella cucumerina]|uniref:Uncharacterized protein n=1 Tax=Plectosphaerella cucumerina TaxID=40658 RepID=A0A8K0X2P0_9PEZI|nr:hypothetical protein B0T11DRAFT_299121 [Plectosphaerella cucumerina]
MRSPLVAPSHCHAAGHRGPSASDGDIARRGGSDPARRERAKPTLYCTSTAAGSSAAASLQRTETPARAPANWRITAGSGALVPAKMPTATTGATTQPPEAGPEARSPLFVQGLSGPGVPRPCTLDPVDGGHGGMGGPVDRCTKTGLPLSSSGPKDRLARELGNLETRAPTGGVPRPRTLEPTSKHRSWFQHWEGKKSGQPSRVISRGEDESRGEGGGSSQPSPAWDKLISAATFDVTVGIPSQYRAMPAAVAVGTLSAEDRDLQQLEKGQSVNSARQLDDSGKHSPVIQKRPSRKGARPPPCRRGNATSSFPRIAVGKANLSATHAQTSGRGRRPFVARQRPGCDDEHR